MVLLMKMPLYLVSKQPNNTTNNNQQQQNNKNHFSHPPPPAPTSSPAEAEKLLLPNLPSTPLLDTNPKIIAMSATFDANLICDYLSKVQSDTPIPSLNVGAHCFPTERVYLENIVNFGMFLGDRGVRRGVEVLKRLMGGIEKDKGRRVYRFADEVGEAVRFVVIVVIISMIEYDFLLFLFLFYL